MNKKVSIVILNFNAGELLYKCIKSIYSSHYPNFEIILVDNNSSDNSHKKCKRYFPQIKLIENKINLGYCEGNNVGLREITGDYCVILNPDTEVEPNWLNVFISEFNKNGKGLYQPKLLTTSDKSVINSAGNMINIFGFGYSIGKGKKDSLEYNYFKEINYASGACLFTSTEILKKVGFFDSYLFAYHDDLEFGWRANQLGIKSFYLPDSVVYHSESYSFGWSARKFFLLERNRWYCILIHYSTFTFLKILPSLIVIEIFISIFFLKKGIFKEKIRALIIILRDINKIRKRKLEIKKNKIFSDKQIIENFSEVIEIPFQVTNSFYSNIFNNVIQILGKFSKIFI